MNTAVTHMREQRTVETVTGPVPVGALGRTLMHEHLQVGLPGWEVARLEPGPTFRDLVERCVDKIEELKSAGYSSLVDPCPADLARDVELMREVSRRTNFNIICATGFYHGELGASAHWKVRIRDDPDAVKYLADMFINEITRGIGDTGVKAGILKTATATEVTSYEDAMLRATARASAATNTPITTHTDGILGDVQIDTMVGSGARAERIIVGHSCGSNDFDYHRSLFDRGAYVGFDRFGMDRFNTDEQRVNSLVRIFHAGHGDRVVVSHDCVACWRGMDRAPATKDGMMHFSKVIIPMLREHGLEQHDVDRLLIDNPRCFFSGAVSANDAAAQSGSDSRREQAVG
jgi:phosphotriesterase-related protein